jgi:hypothetical protein
MTEDSTAKIIRRSTGIGVTIATTMIGTMTGANSIVAVGAVIGMIATIAGRTGVTTKVGTGRQRSTAGGIARTAVTITACIITSQRGTTTTTITRGTATMDRDRSGRAPA